MTVIMPEGVPALGNTAVRWVASIAAATRIPTDVEVNAASPATLDISCALYADGFAPTQSVSRSAARRRMCDRTTLERTTSVTRSLPDVSYAVSPQAATGTDGKKAFETLTEGLSGFLVVRLGLDAKTEEWEAGQFVNVYPVRLGPAMITIPTDEGGEYHVTQSVDISGPVVQNVAIAATGS